MMSHATRRHGLLIFGWLLMAACLCPNARATEYFVSLDGDDAHEGRSMARAFATIQKGVDALAPGDKLTIAPGEYLGGVSRTGLGDAESVTTIRAQVPGTAVLRGDVPAPRFELVQGKRFVYVAAWDAQTQGEPQAVLEHATRSILTPTADPSLLEFMPGLFAYDQTNRRLYISTADMRPPGDRYYSVSVHGESGLYLASPRKVVVDGLVATGFYRIGAKRGGPQMWGIPWGIALEAPQDCIVRHCHAYLNAGGIAVDKATSTRIEGCIAFGNVSQYETMSGNIMSLGGLGQEGTRDVVIENCIAYQGGMGIQQYGWLKGPMLISRSMAWDNRGSNLHIKTGRAEDNKTFGRVERSVAIGKNAGGIMLQHNLIMAKAQYPSPDGSDIRLDDMPELNLSDHMADPDNLDFRLQVDSSLRGSGPGGSDPGPQPYTADVYYVSPQGDDASDGLSVARAWATLAHATRQLRPGDTLYIIPGTYDETLAVTSAIDPLKPINLRGRGRDEIIIQGGLQLADQQGVRIERLTFTQQAKVEASSRIAFENITFSRGLMLDDTTDTRIEHCIFPDKPLAMQRSTITMLRGCVFAQTGRRAAMVIDASSAINYSEYNAYAWPQGAWQIAGGTITLATLQDRGVERYALPMQQGPEPQPSLRGRGPAGTDIGLYHRRQIERDPPRLIGPFVHSVTDTTANIEWWTTQPTGLTVHWGTTPQMQNTRAIEAHRYGTYSLTGLQPGQTYHFKLEAHAMPDQGQMLTFTTPASPATPNVYHVSPDGHDDALGTSAAAAWRTLGHAMEQLNPGDTLLLAQGIYHASVRIRRTGAPGKPITIKAAPGQHVWIDGDSRTLTSAFQAAYKHHLRFDGLYFRGFADYQSMDQPWSDRQPGNGDSGVFVIYHSSDIHITRCFHDGRGGGYAPALVLAVHAPDVLLRNSVGMACMGGLVNYFNCPNLRIEHNVSLGQLIRNHVGVNPPHAIAHLTGNIYTDNSIMSKRTQPLFEIGNVQSLHEQDNCYLLRAPDTQRQMFCFYSQDAYRRAAQAFDIPTQSLPSLALQEITRMSLHEYQSRFSPHSRSIIADPQFAILTTKRTSSQLGPAAFPVDVILGMQAIDFDDLFATHPQLAARSIGLIPTAFADMHFNAPEAQAAH